eukprot:2883343-Prymnesium_polylepis.1
MRCCSRVSSSKLAPITVIGTDSTTILRRACQQYAIGDRANTRKRGECAPTAATEAATHAGASRGQIETCPVSYTHLTLPTICSV